MASPHIVATVAFLATLPIAAHSGCADYETQAEAQKALTLGAYELDTNGTGVACQGIFDQAKEKKQPQAQTCADFPDQEAAQRAYQTGARQLDPDHNGRACDSQASDKRAPPSMIATCADYTTREQAQAAYLSGLEELDRDNDGLACEHLPSQADLAPAEDSDTLGTPSFVWQRNDLGVQPRSSRPFTRWPNH